MTLKSCVKEHAYLPLRSPERAWVFKEGAKGFSFRSCNTFSYFGSKSGEPLMSLFAHLIKCFSKTSFGKLFAPVSDCLHSLFYRIKGYGIRFSFNLMNSLHKGFALTLLLNEKGNKISYLFEGIFRKVPEHLLDLINLLTCNGHKKLYHNITQIHRRLGI